MQTKSARGSFIVAVHRFSTSVYKFVQAKTNYHVHGSDVAMDNRLRIIDSRIVVLNIILRQGEQT
ncbi:hypothetical protein WH47_05987 [Habropoda laboriosa]|uniref:Uncharacterized protein n=1 Tax=Habropoda laboriosa TaxID=597456 RepID=A0A0L7REQ6_9HYME|nr:hypothetical protein WH47_05987 [Habropoda laboriosa]